MGRLPGTGYDRGRKDWVSAKFRSAMLDIGARDVQLVPSQPVSILEDPNHLFVICWGLSKDIGQYSGVVAPKLGQLVRHEGPDPNILQADCVNHPASGLTDSGSGCAGHRFPRKALHDQPAETVQVDEVRELNSVSERTASGNDGISKVDGTDADSEVDPRGPDTDACRLG